MYGERRSEIAHCRKCTVEPVNRGSLAKPAEIAGERTPGKRFPVVLHEEGITSNLMSGSPPFVLSHRQTQIVANWNRAWPVAVIDAKGDSSVLESYIGRLQGDRFTDGRPRSVEKSISVRIVCGDVESS